MKVVFGRGTKDGSVQAGHDTEPRFFPFALCTYGRLEIHLQYLARRPPFEDARLRDELRQRLNRISGIDLGADALDKRPAFPLATFTRGQALDQLLETVAWAYQQARPPAGADDGGADRSPPT